MPANRRERTLLVLVLVCVGAYLATIIIVNPLLKTWEDRQTKIQDLDKVFKKGVHGVALKGKINEAQAKWKDWRATASSADPTETQTDLVNKVNDWAINSRGLTVSSLNPRWAPEEDGCQKLEIKCSLVGTLPSIITFLFQLDASPLPLKIEEMSIMGRDDKGQAQTLSCELRFTRLVLTKDVRSGVAAKATSLGPR